jgi:hypothetical protein
MRDELIPQRVTADIAVNPLEILSKLCQLSRWYHGRDHAIAACMFTDLLHGLVHDARIWVTESAPTPPGAFLSRLSSLFSESFAGVSVCFALPLVTGMS